MNHFLTYEKCPFLALCIVRFASRIMQSEEARFYDRNPLIQRYRGSAWPGDLQWCFGESCPACGRAYELELAIRLPLLPTLCSPAPQPILRFTFHLSRPTTACCAWIDDLLTLVWQMLSPIINVASLGAMIHDAVGISRRECSSEEPRRAYFICGLILCAPPRNHLISCPASRAHARSSCHEILQLKMHLRNSHSRPTTHTCFSWLSFFFCK